MGSSPLVLTLLKMQYSTKIQDAGLWQEPSHHSSILQSRRCRWLLFTEGPAKFHVFLPFQSILLSTSCPGHSETPLCTPCHQPYNAPVPQVPTLSDQQYAQTELQFHLKAQWFRGRAKTLTACPACTQPPSLELEYRSWRCKWNAQWSMPPFTSLSRKHLSFLTGRKYPPFLTGPTCNPDQRWQTFDLLYHHLHSQISFKTSHGLPWQLQKLR